LDENKAREIILKNTEEEFKPDLASYIEKLKKETEENAKKQANAILAKTLYRVSVENSNNFLVETVQLPSEDYK
jgi:hypothetical protein